MPSEEEDQNVLLIYVQRQHDENLKYTERGWRGRGNRIKYYPNFNSCSWSPLPAECVQIKIWTCMSISGCEMSITAARWADCFRVHNDPKDKLSGTFWGLGPFQAETYSISKPGSWLSWAMVPITEYSGF
jgi:hypothetical protein